jgi:argininosuccinate lyase
MWGARLSAPSAEATQYVSSISFDDRIALDVVRVNMAHLLMLVKQGIVSKEEGRAIYGALKKLTKGLELKRALEDVHMCIEEEVVKEVGVEVGGRLHTGKSRNDQVATALRMRAKRFVAELASELLKMREVLLSLSERHVNTIMPGYTHLQHAQPVTLAHYLLAYHDKFERDFHRLLDVYRRIDESPMGSAALAGSSFNLDREYVAKLLGFSRVQENTVDAVSDRDFMVETAFAATMIMTHLSELAEELVLWSTWEFGFAELPDAYSSTSSIMPQKKNPVGGGGREGEGLSRHRDAPLGLGHLEEVALELQSRPAGGHAPRMVIGRGDPEGFEGHEGRGGGATVRREEDV